MVQPVILVGTVRRTTRTLHAKATRGGTLKATTYRPRTDVRYEICGASKDGSAIHTRHCRATTKSTFTRSTSLRESWFDGTDEQVKLFTKVRKNGRTYMKNIPRCTYERRDVHEDHTEMHVRPGHWQRASQADHKSTTEQKDVGKECTKKHVRPCY